jgi:serine/threonine protein kinase
MDEHGHVRLADFGLVVIGDITAGRPTTSRNNSGTAAWMAPERYSDARRAPPVDVYAFACLAYRVSPSHASLIFGKPIVPQ